MSRDVVLTLISLATGVVMGGAVGWWISRHYYRKGVEASDHTAATLGQRMAADMHATVTELSLAFEVHSKEVQRQVHAVPGETALLIERHKGGDITVQQIAAGTLQLSTMKLGAAEITPRRRGRCSSDR